MTAPLKAPSPSMLSSAAKANTGSSPAHGALYWRLSLVAAHDRIDGENKKIFYVRINQIN
jgi:hypothetical protein